MRDSIFEAAGSGTRLSEFVWCVNCERAYRRGEFRWEGKYLMCPYADCLASVTCEGIDWDAFRRRHPQYPEIPELGRVYPLT